MQKTPHDYWAIKFGKFLAVDWVITMVVIVMALVGTVVTYPRYLLWAMFLTVLINKCRITYLFKKMVETATKQK